MSFDLVSICNGLQSTKVRDRNDATNVLEELVTSGLGSLSLKNLALLVSLALQLIQHEKVLYLKASSNSAVESRISKASSCISSLVENSFKRGNNQKNALRYKHIIAILFDIVGVVQVDSSTLFWPCAFDLIRVFNLALQQDFVKDHLGTLDWLLVYRFLIQCIETIQEDNNPNNLALLVEVFTCVCNLIQANESISILYLQIMGPYRRASSAASSGRRRSSVLSPSETSYFRLLPILTKATKLMQREGALTVVLLKIINKLIITLGTEDILFVNKMILLGISILIRYNNSKLSSLQTQMFIFLNLDGVHDYLVLTELPKMNKKPDSADISIRSEEELEDDAESADNELIKYGEEFDDQLEVDNKVLVYDIGVLIQSFFNISLQASFQIPPENIGLNHDFQASTTWFNLISIYLIGKEEEKEVDESELSWLLNLGITKLINSYFRLKSLSLSSYNSHSSTPEPSGKRQRLALIQQALRDSNNVIEFSCSILSSMPTLEVQKGALQLIVFHLQQQKPRVNMQQQINNISETESKTASSEDVNTSLIDFETTILNSAFEVNSLMLARAATTGATHSHPLSKNAVIRTILNCFENPNLNFWVILTCLSIVEDQNSLHGKLAKKFNLQLFKLILPLVNKSTISNVCGIFIYKLVKSLGDDEISHVIDSTTIILLDNIIELSEVNGPSLISKHSIIFWYTFHKVIMKTNLPRKVDVQLRIQEWWLAKFKNINSICTYIKSIGISRISEFLMWLCGVDVMNTDSLIFVREECEDYFYKGPLNEIYYFMKLFSNLQGSIVMRAGVEILDNTETVNLNRIHTLGKIAGGKTEDILTLINKRTDEICNSASDLLVVKFIRVLLFLNICTIAKGLGSISIFTLMLESGIHKCQEEILDIEFTKPAIVEYTDIINKCSKSLIKGLSDKNIGFIKKIFIVNSMVHSMRDHELRNIGYHLNDGFDEDFKSANSANLPTSTPSSYLSLKYCTIRSSRIQILQLMMNLCLRDQISTFENYFPIILDLLNHMNENELLNACVLIVDSCNIDAFSNISTFYIRKFLRIVGEGPLTSPILERNELTIILISKLLGLLIPTITNNPDIELKKDWLDMANWLVKCGEKRLIQSERSFIEYTCFLILSVNLEKVYEVEFMENFFHATNNVKISIVSSAKNLFIGSLPTLLQMSLYKGLFLNFEYPQKSVESSATFCLFFSLLCGINSSFFPINILVSIIFNLIEYYKFHFFIPYIRAAIYQICSSFIGAISPRDLFKLIKFDLLKYWWIYKKSIQEFPYELFGYLDIRSLIELNYKELAAICLSIKTGDVRRKANEKQLICEIAKLKRIDEASIVIDSFPLIIALAYTESGVKNDIQQILKNILGKSYSEQFKLRLLIILLEIIKFIDLSHEKNLKVNDLSEELILNNSEILTPRGVSVSYGSGIELLQTLVGKYLPNASEFWGDTKVQFFLIRRLSLTLTHSKTNQDKLLCLRRIKLVLILGSNNKSFIESYEVIKLLVSTFCQMLDILTVVRQDIFLIMSCFKFSMPDYESIPLVVEILCAITRHGGDGPYYKLLSTIETHNKELDRGYYRNCFKVLHCTTAKLKNDPDEMYLSATDIEEFLASGDELAICKVNNKINDIIFLVSYVFPKEESSIIFRRNKLAAFHLLEIDRGMFEKLSTSFVEWCGNCLAGYYLYHGPDITESDAASEKSHMPARVIENLNILDNVFKKTIALRGTSLEIDASIESIIGVLIWKFEANKTEVLKFIEFQRYYFEFQHLFAIDFHTCVLLHSSDEEVVIPLVTLQDVIESSNPKESAFEAWTTNLSLALITEISRFTSIAPLFSPLLLKVAAFASTVLPDLICVFVKLIGAAASDKVTKILQIFLTLKLNNIDQRYSDLFIRILLEVRSNYKKKLAFFEEIYSKMDLIAFFKIAAGSQLMKTSLLFLEDALNSNDETNESVLVRETKTLQSVYESIDDDDLIFGLPIEPSMKYAMNIINRGNANYNQVKFNSGMFDAEITLSPKENLHCQKTNIIHSMIENGLMGMSSLASTGKIDGEGSQISNEDYEWAWKLNNWDIPVPATGLKPFEQFNEDILIYKTLKQIHDSPAISHKICQNSMLEVLSCENSNETEWLKSIACIASIGDAYQHKNSLACPFNSSTLWFEESNDLESTESILLARRSAFQIFIETNFTMSETIWMKSMIELVRYNSIARSSDRFLQKSLNSAMLLDEISETKFTSSHPDIQRRVKEISKYHSACTLWRQGETSIPVAMLKELNQMPQIYLDSMDHVSTLSLSPELINALLVEWMSKSRQELPSTLMKKYVNPSMGLLSRGDVDVSESTKIYQIFANFCERQLKSQSFRDDINKISSLITSRKAEIDELKSHYNKKAVKATEKVSIQRYYLKLKAQYSQDTRELEVLEANKSELSDKAIEFYLKSINNDINSEENASDMDENVDKFFALWLEYSEREQINKKIRKDLLALPMHKLISWCPQLVSRISQAPTEFQDSLQKLILNLCEAHPFHSLYNLFSLAKHESSSKLNPTSTKAAIQIWQKLKTGSKNQPILNEIEKFCDEAIKLAEVKVARGKCIQLDKPLTRGTTRTTDSSGSVCDYSWWLNSLPHIPPPTLELKIDLTLLYHDCPTFAMISPKIEIATSGLSLPKIATFLLNDGSTHKMLLKHGADDLRQDSIMEQVFEKVNQMFWKDKETRKRNLRIRTYKAIPLGPQNGIIQFVPNSMALIDVIKPYHLVMDKMKVETARERMKKCQGGAKATRLSVYDDIIDDKIEPVLRHFFFDTFTSPEAWFQSRILYTHGVAATSIVGYMLGLGDRHCNNILLDKETGEPIHIDLGVAFDQGKRLPIPETVPFRLTRDIVDGFGITGVEGTFRKSCEHSFRVLRQNKDHVIAILDVLRWDPLYSWTLSPLRKNKLQDDGDGEGEEATEVAEEVAPAQIHEDGSEAGRAISKVADKLVGGGLSVEATVRELIQEATNKENLAVIYCGWCPFF